MHKVIIAFSLLQLIRPAYSEAQPIITALTNNPVAGDMFMEHGCDTTGINEGPGGAGITWDFSNLITAGSDTLTYLTNLSPLPCGLVSGSNLKVIPAPDTFYYAATTDSFSFVGFNSTYGNCYGFYNPQVRLKYPFTYNSNYIDSAGFIVAGTTSYASVITCDTIKYDGYGTLTLPGHTYTNAVRITDLQSQVDSNMVSGIWQVNFYSRTYNWYAPGIHNPLLTITYVTQPWPHDTIKTVTYCNALQKLAAPELQTIAASLQLFPNPVKEELNIKFTVLENEQVRISVLDIVGKEIGIVTDEIYEKGDHLVSWQTNQLPKGVYLIRFNAANETITRKIEVL